MKIEFAGRGIDISPELRSHTKAKLERLKKHVDDIHDVNVVLTVEKYRNKAEISVHTKHKTFHGQDETTDMAQSIDSACEKLEKQARRFNGKRTKNKRNTNESIRINVLSVGDKEMDDADEPSEKEIKIIKSNNFVVKPMVLEEAVEELEKLKKDFIIFHNSESESMNVVYRRKDGNVGYIETTYA